MVGIIYLLGGPGCGKSLLAHYANSIYDIEIIKLPTLDYKELIKDMESFDNPDIVQKYNKKKDLILEETQKKVKYMLDNWTKTFIVYPIVYKEQTDDLGRRSYIFTLTLECPTLKRYKNFCDREANQKDIPLDSFLKLDDLIQYKIMTPEKNYIVKNYIVNDSSTEVFFSKVARCEFLANCAQSQVKPPWDNYFMRIAYVSRARSNCMKRSVGAVLVKNKRIVSIGYNGTPQGMTNCMEGGCERCNANMGKGEQLEKCLCIHGEESAILECGVHIAKGCTLYCTMFPCVWCAKIIIQAGIAEIVYGEDYNMELSKKILFQAKIPTRSCDLQDKQF